MAGGCNQFRVADTVEWNATHKSHGKPIKTLNEHQPPKGTYKISTLTCPCGAKHVITEKDYR